MELVELVVSVTGRFENGEDGDDDGDGDDDDGDDDDGDETAVVGSGSSCSCKRGYRSESEDLGLMLANNQHGHSGSPSHEGVSHIQLHAGAPEITLQSCLSSLVSGRHWVWAGQQWVLLAQQTAFSNGQ